MDEHAYEIVLEIEATIEDGTYSQLASPEADEEAARVGALLARVDELSNEDVDRMLAAVREAPSVDTATSAREVRTVISKARSAALPDPGSSALNESYETH
jgi:acyl-CoA reductase-like NAD-dependent aldehyde dehydrogenase